MYRRWIIPCLVLPFFSEISLSQCKHWYVFSPGWIIACILKWCSLAKAYPQCLHLYGFSPVCFLPVSQDGYILENVCHNGCIEITFPLCVFSCCIQSINILKISFPNNSIGMEFPNVTPYLYFKIPITSTFYTCIPVCNNMGLSLCIWYAVEIIGIT